MRSRSVGRVRTGLLVSRVAACLVLSGAWAEAARAKEAKGPAARRDRKGGRRKGGQAAGRKKSGQGADAGKKGGPRGVIQLARLNARALKTLYGKLDADSSGSVSLDEFKALPKVLQKLFLRLLFNATGNGINQSRPKIFSKGEHDHRRLRLFQGFDQDVSCRTRTDPPKNRRGDYSNTLSTTTPLALPEYSTELLPGRS